VSRFVKSHGLGNDYLVLAEDDLGFPLVADTIRRLCHRSLGLGADGILLRVASPRADFGVRIFNPDGSEAEKSGNGLRIFAKYAYEHAGASGPRFSVETAAGVVGCMCEVVAGRISSVTVEMGRASFVARDVPMSGAAGEAVGVPLELDDQAVTVTAVSLGNPHCVVLRDRLDEAEVRTLGPRLEHHPTFPRRTNVQFARLASPGRLEILIWERGAGFTLASGSSACAAAAAAVKLGLTPTGPVTVSMPGGTLSIEVRPDWTISLSGPVEEVASGTLSPDLVATLNALARTA
jgi:diaminopimelate epimerase